MGELKIPTGSNSGWLVPDAVDTVICGTDDGCTNRPKHVEQFTDENILRIVASCWTFIDIELRCTVP